MYNEIGQRTFLQNVITGSIAGSSVFFSTLPLDYIKQWRQSNYSFLDIRNTIKNNSFKGQELFDLSYMNSMKSSDTAHVHAHACLE